MLDAIKRLSDRGAEAVVLGSSEIPVLVTEQNSPIPVYDSVALLADGAVRCAAGHLTMPARR
jgi:aspartate racemase